MKVNKFGQQIIELEWVVRLTNVSSTLFFLFNVEEQMSR